jgi:hypothetical protein
MKNFDILKITDDETKTLFKDCYPLLCYLYVLDNNQYIVYQNGSSGLKIQSITFDLLITKPNSNNTLILDKKIYTFDDIVGLIAILNSMSTFKLSKLMIEIDNIKSIELLKSELFIKHGINFYAKITKNNYFYSMSIHKPYANMMKILMLQKGNASFNKLNTELVRLLCSILY